jgi:antitoxin MazE
MKTRVQKWGNSLAVRIPQHFVREAGLEYNASVEMNVEDGKLVIQKSAESPTLDELLSKVTPKNLHLLEDNGGPVGNEAW